MEALQKIMFITAVTGAMAIAHGEFLLGQPCETLSPMKCARGLTCEEDRGVCVFSIGQNCASNRTMCFKGHSCDANDKCKRKVNYYCFHDAPCGAGAECMKNRCKCIEKIFKTQDKACVPEKGTVRGPCRKNGQCDDPNATCNQETHLCECKPSYVPDHRNFSCHMATPSGNY